MMFTCCKTTDVKIPRSEIKICVSKVIRVAEYKVLRLTSCRLISYSAFLSSCTAGDILPLLFPYINLVLSRFLLQFTLLQQLILSALFR